MSKSRTGYLMNILQECCLYITLLGRNFYTSRSLSFSNLPKFSPTLAGELCYVRPAYGVQSITQLPNLKSDCNEYHDIL